LSGANCTGPIRTLLFSAVGNTQILAFDQQRPLQALNDSPSVSADLRDYEGGAGIDLTQCLARWGLQLSLSLKEDASNDQIDNSIADAGRWHGNRNDGGRAARLVGWL
jgi:hypothetical protein